MKVNNEKKVEFPDAFWNKERQNVTFKETLNDVIPIEWKNGNDKVIVYSSKEMKVKK